MERRTPIKIIPWQEVNLWSAVVGRHLKVEYYLEREGYAGVLLEDQWGNQYIGDDEGLRTRSPMEYNWRKVRIPRHMSPAHFPNREISEEEWEEWRATTTQPCPCPGNTSTSGRK